MKKWWVLFFALSMLSKGMSQASVLLPAADYPGFFGLAGATLPEGLPTFDNSPAKRTNTLSLGLLWGIPAAGVDLQSYSLIAEWGNSWYRMGSLFSMVAMDSVYRSSAGDLELAFTFQRYTVGVGHSVNVEWVPGIGSWWTQQTKVGLVVEVPRGFSLSGLLLFPYESEFNYLGGVHWKASESYRLFVEVGPKNFHIGHTVNFEYLRIQSAYAFPGPSVGIGLAIQIDQFFSGFGYQKISDAFDAKGASLVWRKK